MMEIVNDVTFLADKKKMIYKKTKDKKPLGPFFSLNLCLKKWFFL